jgi:hypothetical protein
MNPSEAEAKNDHQGRIAPPTPDALFILPRPFCQGGHGLFYSPCEFIMTAPPNAQAGRLEPKPALSARQFLSPREAARGRRRANLPGGEVCVLCLRAIGSQGKAMTALERQAPSGISSPAERATPASLLARPAPIGLVVAALVAAGLVVRLWCARGPLWLDEIWSIENLAPLTRFWQVFWGISHDNNHFLNSLWLYFATGLSADERILRAPSIAMGAMTVAMAARVAARHSPAAAVAAGAMAAASYFLVNYSVEARGYAGMALAILVAFDAMERATARPGSRARFAFAAAAGIGLLWHLAMLPVVALFALIHLCEQRREIGGWEPAAAATLRFLAPTFVAVLPALACLVAGVAVVGRLTIGGVRAFDAGLALGAIADMARDTIGLPLATPTGLILAAGAAAIAIALRLRLVLDDRRIAYAVILLALPAAVFILRPPNAHIPRYYLVCALFLVLLIAEVFGSLWRAGAWGRAAALAALAGMLIGDASLLIRYQASKETAWPQALTAVADSGQTALASSFDDRVGKFVAYYNRGHPPLDLVARADWCVRRPQWFIAETANIVDLPQDLDLPAGDCRVRFAFARRFETWGLSQVGWALYRAR